jgi:hypothetical protein
MNGYPLSELLAALPIILAIWFVEQSITDFRDWLDTRRTNRDTRRTNREFELRIGMPIPVWDAIWNLYNKLEAGTGHKAASVDFERICAVYKIDQRKAIYLFLDELKRRGKLRQDFR